MRYTSKIEVKNSLVDKVKTSWTIERIKRQWHNMYTISNNKKSLWNRLHVYESETDYMYMKGCLEKVSPMPRFENLNAGNCLEAKSGNLQVEWPNSTVD